VNFGDADAPIDGAWQVLLSSGASKASAVAPRTAIILARGGR